MNRQTIRNSDGSVSRADESTVEAELRRLAEYEDTGFTPMDIAVMRNELCTRCGKYRYAHEGACNDCRFK